MDRQQKLCEDLARRRGLRVVGSIEDNDVSAYRAKRRPGFEALVEALKAGEAQAVVVYHVDRLYRRMGDLERLVEIVEATGVEIHTVAAGDVDLATASGRMIARMLGAAAQHESERIGERMRAKHDELASAGKAPGGRPPYGYRWVSKVGPGGSVLRNYAVAEDEATAVRRMADRVLQGASLLAISKELDAAKITTREGRPWHHSTVRAVLINPAVTGLRVHRREVAGEGTWEPILDRATWEEIRATLADPARKRTRPARRHLLSGLVVNELGERMNGAVSNLGAPIYMTRVPCKQSRQVPAIPLEELVTEAVLLVLDKASLPDEDEQENPAAAEIVRLDAEMKELAELRGSGQISLAEWMAAREPLKERIEAARAAAGPRRRPGRHRQLLTERGAARRAWPDLDFAGRREIIEAVVEKITVGPATKGRWTKLADRVDISWRG